MNTQQYRPGNIRKVAICLLALCLLASAPSSPRLASQHYSITWSAFNYGGGKTNSSNYALVSAIGSCAAPRTKSQSFWLDSGFFAGVQVLLQNGHYLYLPLIRR
jgi:hypothetical protein